MNEPKSELLAQIQSIYEESDLTPDERQEKAAALLVPARAEMVKLKTRIDELKGRRESNEKLLAMLGKQIAWMESESPVLQANEHTRLHGLRDAIAAGEVYIDGERSTQRETVLAEAYGTFVVKHDWAAVVSCDVGDEIVLPFPICAFEFVISSVPVIVLGAQEEGCRPVATCFVSIDGIWSFCPPEAANVSPALLLAWRQVVACCVSLDAEVTRFETRGAPAKLNEKRARNDRSPVLGVSVIDLNRKVVKGAGHGGGGRKRLHFRRGHWRHYEDHKTWIKWQLVGNPDLGFVASQYAL
jgi:hypothetical protein